MSTNECAPLLVRAAIRGKTLRLRVGARQPSIQGKLVGAVAVLPFRNKLQEADEGLMDRATFFAIMGAFPTGVAVVTTMDEHNHPRGLTSNALCSVSAEPPLLLICVDKNSNTLPALRHSRKLVVNYLSAGRGDLANLFASKEPDKFQAISWRPGSNGMPWLHSDTIAHAECDVTEEINAGDHLIFLAEVQDGQPPAPATKPLMYFRRSYGTWHDG